MSKAPLIHRPVHRLAPARLETGDATKGAPAGLPRYLARAQPPAGPPAGTGLAAEAAAERLVDGALQAPAAGGAAGEPGASGSPPDPPRSQRSGGTDLGALRAPLEARTGVDLSGVRVHHTPRLTRALGAEAFAYGADIHVGGAVSERILAHEAAHVAQQAAAGRSAVQRSPDPTRSTLDPVDVATWDEDDTAYAVELLSNFLTTVDLDDVARQSAMSNLHVLIDTVALRRMRLPDSVLLRLPPDLAGGTESAELPAMTKRLDVMAAMVRQEFPDAALLMTDRLDGYKRLIRWYDATALADAGLMLDESFAALEVAVRIKRLALDPGGDADVSIKLYLLNAKLFDLLDALNTPQLQQAISAVEIARDDWMGSVADTFYATATGLREGLAKTINPDDYGLFADGLPLRMLSRQADRIGALEIMRDWTLRSLDALIEHTPGPSFPLEERLAHVAENSERLADLRAQAEAVEIGRAICEQGKVLADVTYQEWQTDPANAGSVQWLADKLAYVVDTPFTPDRLPELQRSAAAAIAYAGTRIEAIRKYQGRVAWAVNIAAMLLGGFVMRGVMALPRVAALGKFGAGVLGSISFTATRLAVTANQGKPLTVTGLLADIGKDYLLFRLLGGVDARISARLGQETLLAKSARFGGAYATMLGWALTWNAIDAARGMQTQSAGDTALHTGLDLIVLTLAHGLQRAPELPESGGKGSTSTTLTHPRSEAYRVWEALRTEMRKTGNEMRDWLQGGRQNVNRGDRLLVEAAEQFTRLREVYEHLETAGEITTDQRVEIHRHADQMVESIENARNELRLDVQRAGEETWSYRGTAENVSAYLAQLQRQGRITEFHADPGEVYVARTADGAYQYFFPEGRTSPVFIDVVAESINAAAPDVPGPTRGQALAHLRGAGWADLAPFAGSLAPGSAGPFVRWAARADVGAALAGNGLPLPVVRTLAENPRQLEAVAGEGPHQIKLWYSAWAQRNPDGQPGAFLDAFRDVLGWRGTMAVVDVEEAGALIDRRAAALTPQTIRVRPPPTATSMSGVGAEAPVESSALTAALRDDVVPAGSYQLVERGTTQWVIESVDNAITRLLEIGADGSVVRRVPVTAHLETLREVLAAVREAPDEAAARTALARSDAPLQALGLLLELRSGVPAGQVRLLDELANHPLRRPAIAPPVAGFGGNLPLASPQDPLHVLPPELVAVAYALPDGVQEALRATAVWDASRVAQLLRQPIMVAEFRANPAAATTFLRVLIETRGRLPLYDPHLHGRGAIRFARRMALDIVEASPNGRQAVLDRRLEFGEAMAAALDAPGFPTVRQWPGLRAELEALAARLGRIRPREVPAALRADAQALGERMEAALSLGIERAGEPQVQRFFDVYALISKTFKTEGLPAILAAQAESGTGGLEIRSDERLPEVDPITGGTRRIISRPGNVLGTRERTRQQTLFAGILSNIADPEVVGFDVGGQESSGRTLGVMVDASLMTHAQNYSSMAAWLWTRPNTATALRGVLGYDPLGTNSMDLFRRVMTEQARRRDAILSENEPLPPPLPEAPVADLAASVRRMRDGIGRIAAESAVYPGVTAELAGGVLPPGMRGITIHAGEQVASGKATLQELMQFVDDAIVAGADRIGHATVLGIRFPDDLGQLGFRQTADGNWQRRVGGVEQTIRGDEIAALEQRRRALLTRIADLGIPIEVPPTSNIMLAGLAPLQHPAGRMRADEPGLRLVPATDNPAIHRTDMPTEAALLAAAAGMDAPGRSVMYLDTYASRLGSRPLANVQQLSETIVRAIVEFTPPGERFAVITALYERWPIGALPEARSAGGADAFEAKLRRIVRAVIY